MFMAIWSLAGQVGMVDWRWLPSLQQFQSMRDCGPEISYHVLYPVSPDLATSRLSTDTYGGGQPGGLSLHGYWVNGWDPDIQSAWVTHCVNQRVDCASHLLGDGRAISGDA